MRTERRKLLTLAVAMATALSLAAGWPCAAQLVPKDLNPPDAMISTACDINSSGQIVGVCYYADLDGSGNIIGYHLSAVLWDSTGSIKELDPEKQFGNISPSDINDSGQVVGTWQRGELDRGVFIWDAVNGMVDVGALSHDGVADTDIHPIAINATGCVIGGSQDSNGTGHSWIYRGGVLEELIDAMGRRFYAVGINDEGQVAGWVIGVSESDYPAAIWEKPNGATVPTVTALTSGEIAQAVAINNRGEVVVHNFYLADVRIWQPDGTRNADGTLSGTLRRLHIGGDVTYDEGGNPTYPHYWDTVTDEPAWIYAEGIDNNGRVFGWVELTPEVPGEPYTVKLWVWDNGTVTDVVAPGDPSTSLTSPQMNDSGQMIGGYLDQETWVSYSFLWQVGDAATQNLPGLTSGDVDAYAINNAGQVVGQAYTLSPALGFTPHACMWGGSAPINNPPVLIVPSDSLETVVGTPVAFTATATDDPGDTLTFHLEGAPASASIDPDSGAFTWTPAAAGQYTFTVKVTDAGGLSDSSGVTVEVGEVIRLGKATVSAKAKTVSVQVPLTNMAASAAKNVMLTTATLGGVAATGSLNVGTIKPGATVTVTLTFKNVASGNQTLVTAGSSSVGAFSKAQVVRVP